MLENNNSDRLQRGYKQNLQPHEIKEFKRRFLNKTTWPALPLALTYNLSIMAASYMAWRLSANIDPLLWIPMWALTAIIIARQMRALENIVHFGSHNNFSRSGSLNDLICNLIAGWPLLQSVARYRQFHHMHHGHYGSEKDPCKSRFAMMANRQSIRTTSEFLLAVVRWMPGYIKSYYSDIGTKNSTILCFAAWHSAIFTGISQLFSPSAALHMLLLWSVAFFFVLPVIRSIAEYGEHDYARDTTVFHTTYSNLSFLDRLIFHPAGDAYHLIHHLYPSIPWWRQRKAHNYLAKNDIGYSSALCRTRFSDKAFRMKEAL